MMSSNLLRMGNSTKDLSSAVSNLTGKCQDPHKIDLEKNLLIP